MKARSVYEHDVIPGLTDADRSTLDSLRGPQNETLFRVGWVRRVRATNGHK